MIRPTLLAPLGACLILITACTPDDDSPDLVTASDEGNATTPTAPDAPRQARDDSADATGNAVGTAIPDPADAPATVGRACGDLAPAPLTPDAAKGETGARTILLSLAAAIEQREFACAEALMGDARGAMSASTLAARLDKPGTISVAVPSGRVEGAAGSLYYQVPMTITLQSEGRNAATLKGPVTLRRVNDVPGATPEQLRWHFEQVALKPGG